MELSIGSFDFIKISTQIINKFSKIRQTKNNLIYVEIIKVNHYIDCMYKDLLVLEFVPL
jgi:hypothetical protein